MGHGFYLWKKKLSKIYPRIFYEVYTGFGITQYIVQTNLPNGTEDLSLRTGGLQLSDGTHLIPNLPLGIHIGCTFN